MFQMQLLQKVCVSQLRELLKIATEYSSFTQFP